MDYHLLRLCRFTDFVAAAVVVCAFLLGIGQIGGRQGALGSDGGGLERQRMMVAVVTIVCVVGLWMMHRTVSATDEEHRPATQSGVHCVWLLSVVSLLWPASLMAATPGDFDAATGLFSGLIMMACGATCLQALMTWRRNRNSTEPSVRFTDVALRSCGLTVTAVLAFVFTVSVPRAGWWFLVFYLAWAAHAARRERQRMHPGRQGR